jgi:hypothetical protein
VKAAPSAGRENTLEGEQPQESYEPGIGLNRRRRAMDSRVEQSPEGEGRLRGFHNVVRHRAPFSDGTRCRRAWSRRAGTNDKRARGAGDGVRLRGRRKALKGTTPRADPA